MPTRWDFNRQMHSQPAAQDLLLLRAKHLIRTDVKYETRIRLTSISTKVTFTVIATARGWIYPEIGSLNPPIYPKLNNYLYYFGGALL